MSRERYVHVATVVVAALLAFDRIVLFSAAASMIVLLLRALPKASPTATSASSPQ